MFEASLVYAKLRVADPVADAAAYPNNNLLWRLAALPYNTLVKIACTAKLLLYRGDALHASKPQVLELIDRISGYLGFQPEYLFMSSFPTYILGEYKISRDPISNQAILEHHRGSLSESGLFTKGFSAGGLLDTIREIFLDSTIEDNDMMLTCSETFTKEYRKWLHQLIGVKSIHAYNDLIKDEAANTLNSWISQCSDGKQIDLRRTGQFPSRVLTRMLFESSEGSDEISEALNDINWYTIHRKISLRIKPEDKIRYENACKIFRETLERIMRDDIPLFSVHKGCTLTEQQKKAMAAVLFFAGQETTGFFLASILLYLAQNPDKQENLRQALESDLSNGKLLLSEIINHILGNYPPAFMVGRRITPDTTLCLDYRLEHDAVVRKFIILPGTGLSAGIMRAAEKVMETAPEQMYKPAGYQKFSPFGSGVHACPGRHLAESEVETIVIMTVLRCQIRTEEVEDPQVIGSITMQFARPYHITLDELPSRVSSSQVSSSSNGEIGY